MHCRWLPACNSSHATFNRLTFISLSLQVWEILCTFCQASCAPSPRQVRRGPSCSSHHLLLHLASSFFHSFSLLLSPLFPSLHCHLPFSFTTPTKNILRWLLIPFIWSMHFDCGPEMLFPWIVIEIHLYEKFYSRHKHWRGADRDSNCISNLLKYSLPCSGMSAFHKLKGNLSKIC